MKGGSRLFRARPARIPPGELAALLAENPAVLGPGWRLLGEGGELGDREAPLLLGTPEGELVVCLAAEDLDPSLLARGRALLEEARRTLAFLGRFRLPGWPRLERVRLLLVGGSAAPPVLAARGEEVTVLLVSLVEGQPGPPLVVSEPPPAEGAEPTERAPEGGEEESPETPPLPEPPLEDGEVERLISLPRNQRE